MITDPTYNKSIMMLLLLIIMITMMITTADYPRKKFVFIECQS